MDAYAERYQLKKKTTFTSDDKKARKALRGIRYDYITKDKQRIVSLLRSDMKASDETYYSTDLYVYSSRKNTSKSAGSQLLGCMAYTITGNSFMHVVPVYGAALGDKAKVAADAYAKSGQSERSYQYEWMPGMTLNQVEQKWGKQFKVILMNAYHLN